MYISQNLRQSWYGNLLGEDENDDDQDAMKVRKSIEKKCSILCGHFSVPWWKQIRIYLE